MEKREVNIIHYTLFGVLGFMSVVGAVMVLSLLFN